MGKFCIGWSGKTLLTSRHVGRERCAGSIKVNLADIWGKRDLGGRNSE